MAEAMGGKLVYAIIPHKGAVEEIVMAQARRKAKRIIQRTRAHMALEEQIEGLRSQEEMIEELAKEIAREMPRDFWK
jgi:cell division protein FtsB